MTMTTSAAAPTCNTLWIGGDLGPIGAACLASFVRRGHRTVLHCYDAPRDAPAGVELADAAATVPSSRLFRHKESGSYSLFSNLFRYELIRRGLGLWIDCDVYCLRRFAFDSDYVYGWEGANSINGAVLGLPKESPVLEKLIALFATRAPVLPWLSSREQSTLLAKRLAGEGFGLADLPWGVAGPQALTYFLTEAGLARHARAHTVFYPIPANRGFVVLQRGVDVAELMTPKTLAVHLWNEILRKHVVRRNRARLSIDWCPRAPSSMSRSSGTPRTRKLKWQLRTTPS